MQSLKSMIKRNIKLFFLDKGLFFTALITPLILLVLYATFLSNVYKDAFFLIVEPTGISVSNKIVNGFAGGQLLSSLLAVAPITVPFCANMLMVSDKISGARRDFMLTPLNKNMLALSYYASTLIASLIICAFALVICLVYIAIVGWFFSFLDVLLLLLDVIVLVFFGTALSSVVNVFLTSQGQISAVGSIVSSGYGFISGAYMPISSFSSWLKNAVAFFPSTYGTSIIRTHALGCVTTELKALGVDKAVVQAVADSVDCSVFFFDSRVPIGVAYGVLLGSIALLIGLFVILHVKRNKKERA